MMTEPSEVASVFAGTPLAGLPTDRGPGETILVRDVPPDQLVDAWRTAHALVPAIGRWPILLADNLEALFDRPTTAELADCDRTARTLDPWPIFHPWSDTAVTADDLAFHTTGWASDLDLTNEALRQVPLPTTEQVIGRWVYDRVRTDPDLTSHVQQHAQQFLQADFWFTPDRVWLLLPPTAHPWLAMMWVDFYGAEAGPDEFHAALWQWHQRRGAHLVACWGTMLQFLVSRPPAPGDQAWNTASQIMGMASHLDLHTWELATALPDGRAWFIHSRP